MKARMMPRLYHLLGASSEISFIHGVPMEAVLIHLAQLASSLTGHAITFGLEDENSASARFSLLVCSPGPSLPVWMRDEWIYLEQSQEDFARHESAFMGTPEARQGMRRQKRLLEAVGQGSTFACRALEATLNRAKTHKPFAPLRRIGRGRQGISQEVANGSFLAEDWKAVRMVLRGRSSSDGYWSRLDLDAPSRATLLGWMSKVDWTSFTSEPGCTTFERLGWVIEVPASSSGAAKHIPRCTLSELMLKRFEWGPCHNLDFRFEPRDGVREALEEQVDRFKALAASVPEAERRMAVPDIYIGWKLAALFGAICQDGEESHRQVSQNQGAILGIILAHWLVAGHFHKIRRSFPSDEIGRFTGTRARLCGFLEPEPTTIRSFQRRLRAVDSGTCLQHLKAAVRAGVAVETAEGRFAASVPPYFGPTLSAFLSEFE